MADAVLYEGYLLYPYRRSSQKNRVRWQFGVLAPRQWLHPSAREDDSLSGSADGWYQQTECLLEAPRDAEVHVRLRFLQTVRRTVEQAGADGGFVPVDRLTVDDRDYLTFDEAIPREFDITTTLRALMQGPVVRHIDVPGGESVEELVRGAGRIVRSSGPLSAVLALSVAAATAPFPVWKLRVRTENHDQSTVPGVSRSEALRASLISTHTVIGLTGGAFLSRIDPPEWAAPAAKACRNVHTFPVLAGDPARRDVMLSAPIVMYDHPQVSPESPGDLFDATEIDEILSLRTGTLTDDEKREARATDPRAAAIIDRVEQLPPEVMDRLHGAIRGLQPRQPTAPETVIVDGARIGAGSRVRLRPRRRGADAHDIFLTGRTARVEKVLTDIDGERRIAVTVDDDPGADLHQWYGRYYYFDVDEVTPIYDLIAPKYDPLRDRLGGRPQT
ncbi:hypothetical protein [Mycolicibacterium duvalii]|uniref:hypothetical protein n=1 Tax=Mycolicibacterium duvalii TaxID=39688 RepID=UPI0015D3C260|nr:hypothetical protein [Mycolicibacterium duvalii]MCV7368110.1 hypothetical protein [Mycolicibacterium duvalii]